MESEGGEAPNIKFGGGAGETARYARVTHRRKSALVLLATSLSRPIPDTRGCLCFQRRALPATSRSPWAKTRNEIIRVGVLHRSAFRESRRFTASVSIRQPHVSLAPVGPVDSARKSARARKSTRLGYLLF